MTTNFSFSRLGRLITKQWVENARLYLFSSLALLGMMGLVFLFWINNNRFLAEDTAYIIFLVGPYITGAVFASMAFGMMGEKPKASYWLSFPASHLEKLISVIFYTTIVFVVVYSACFLIVKSLADVYIYSLIEKFPDKYQYRRVDLSGGFGRVFWPSVYGFFAVQAFYLLGSVYFSRYSFVITTVIGTVLVFLYFYYIASLTDGLIHPPYAWQGFRVAVYDSATPTYKSYELSPVITEPLTFIFKYGWAPLFWVVTWFRLKEKQV